MFSLANDACESEPSKVFGSAYSHELLRPEGSTMGAQRPPRASGHRPKGAALWGTYVTRKAATLARYESLWYPLRGRIIL